MHIVYTQKSLIYILVYYYGVYYSNNISCIHKKIYSLSLLNFSGTGFQPNTSSLYLPREANFIETPSNSHATLFTRQVTQVSNQTGPKCISIA